MQTNDQTLNSNNNNTGTPVPVSQSAINTNIGAPTKTTPSSSPWEEELPEEPKKDLPTVIGSLGPTKVTNNQPLKIPENVEDKVGEEIKVSDVVGPKQVGVVASNAPAVAEAKKATTPQVETVQRTNPASSPDVSPQIESIQVSPMAQEMPPKTNLTKTSIPQDIKPPAQTPSIKADVNVAPTSSKKINVMPETKQVESIKPPAYKSQIEDIDWFGGDEAAQDTVPVPVTPTTPPPVPISNPVDTISPIEPEVSQSETVALETNESANIIPDSADEPTPKKEGFSLLSVLSKMRIKRILLPFFGLLVLTIIILTSLNEFGIFSIGFEKVYGSIGLERLWGGLPQDPGRALAQSFITTKDHLNFKAKGLIEVKVDASIPSPISSPLVGVKKGISNVSSEVNFQNNPTASYAELKITSGLGENTVLLQNNGDKFYVQGKDRILLNKEAEKWAEYIIGPLTDKKIQEELFARNLNVKIEGNRIGAERIEGENCYHYNIKDLDFGDNFEQAGINSDMVQGISGDIWIGIKNKLIRRINLKITTPVSTAFSMIEADLIFYDYDAVNEIKSIDQNKIISGKPTSGSTNTVMGATNSLESGDDKRKSDVEYILNALQKYKIKYGGYPDSKNSLIPLSDETNVVHKALVPEFVTEIPRDENALFNWYYAYKSDGKTCSVSARLSDKSDPEGQKMGDLLLYIKYNSD